MKLRYLKSLVCIRFSLAGLLLCGVSLAGAQSWTVQTLSTRVLPDGQNVTVAIAVPPPMLPIATVPTTATTTTAATTTTEITATSTPASVPAVRHVLIYPLPLGIPQLKVASGPVTHNLGGTWMRALPQLQAQGVSLVYVDAPSDAANRSIGSRPSREVRQDLAAAAKEAQQLFPGAQIHLAGFSSVAPLLDIAGDLDGFGKVVLAASSLAHYRTSDWSSLSKPVLMLHAPGTQCEGAPFLEAQMLARRSRFTFVQVGYTRPDTTQDCGRTSQHVLQRAEARVAKVVADWLDGKEVALAIGYSTPQISWREEIITYQAPSTFGSNQLEATLLLPEARHFGAGPYPVMVWSHGDVELDDAPIRYKSRIREMVVAREFLQLGVAVLMPARRGVGMSEGTYPKGFSVNDGDAIYKARVHAEDILPALAWLKTRPELDASRVTMAGQSAGGYSTMYIASQNPAGLIGAIDFSGGRTDKTIVSDAGHLNQRMVDGFAEFGKTTRVPTLWVFAENDSRYTANTIRASHEAFQAAGGKARLSLSPPLQGDGHFIYSKPELWRAALKEYLGEIGVVKHAK